MSPKKKHEVLYFSHFIKEHFNSILMNSKSFIIDIGSGLGYLDQMLWYLYGYQVVGIESSTKHGEAADKRNTSLVDGEADYRKPSQIISTLENTEESVIELSK